VAIPPSPEATAAADAAAADLKTLQQQITANPPSGASQAAMPSSEYLGQNYDLYDGQTILPTPVHRPPDSLHRRARPRWRHGWGHE